MCCADINLHGEWPEGFLRQGMRGVGSEIDLVPEKCLLLSSSTGAPYPYPYPLILSPTFPYHTAQAAAPIQVYNSGGRVKGRMAPVCTPMVCHHAVRYRYSDYQPGNHCPAPTACEPPLARFPIRALQSPWQFPRNWMALEPPYTGAPMLWSTGPRAGPIGTDAVPTGYYCIRHGCPVQASKPSKPPTACPRARTRVQHHELLNINIGTLPSHTVFRNLLST